MFDIGDFIVLLLTKPAHATLPPDWTCTFQHHLHSLGEHFTAAMKPTMSTCQVPILPLGGWVTHFNQCLRLRLNWRSFGYQSHALPTELLRCHSYSEQHNITSSSRADIRQWTVTLVLCQTNICMYHTVNSIICSCQCLCHLIIPDLLFGIKYHMTE